MAKRLLDFPLGSIVSVPLDNSESAVAIALRRNDRRKGPRETFFGVAKERIKEGVTPGAKAESLKYTDLCAFVLCSDLSVREGLWKVIGAIEPFDQNEWFVPPFGAKSPYLKDKDLVEMGLPLRLLAENCQTLGESVRGDTWLSLKDYKELPAIVGLGDAEALRSACLLLRDKKEKSISWCEPTLGRIKLWRKLRNLMLERNQRAATP